MIYTKQEKQKLERVIAVFAERLKESDAFDLVWSDKVEAFSERDIVESIEKTKKGKVSK